MKKTTSWKDSFINLGIIVTPVLLIWGVSTWKDSNIPECTQTDLYDFQHPDMAWQECKNNKQIRKLKKTDEVKTCKNPGKVTTPELEKSCEITVPICTKDDFKFSEWSECSKEGERQKGILGKKENSQCKLETIPEPIFENCEYRTSYLISENEQVLNLIESPLSLADIWETKIFNKINTYPKIKINSSNIEKLYLKVTVDFNDHFKKYKKGRN